MKGTYSISTGTSIELLDLASPKVSRVFKFMAAKCAPYETISLFLWTRSLFYIEIIDTRIKTTGAHSAAKMACGLTVDLKTDQVYWNDDRTLFDDIDGGNCFVRAPKWKGIMRRYFNLGRQDIFEARFHVYASCADMIERPAKIHEISA